MSIFKVEVVKIKNILLHPNADRLEIAIIEGMAEMLNIDTKLHINLDTSL